MLTPSSLRACSSPIPLLLSQLGTVSQLSLPQHTLAPGQLTSPSECWRVAGLTGGCADRQADSSNMWVVGRWSRWAIKTCGRASRQLGERDLQRWLHASPSRPHNKSLAGSQRRSSPAAGEGGSPLLQALQPALCGVWNDRE